MDHSLFLVQLLSFCRKCRIRELFQYIRHILEVVPIMLFLDVVPSSLVDKLTTHVAQMFLWRVNSRNLRLLGLSFASHDRLLLGALSNQYKNSDSNFQKFLVTNETEFSGNSGKEDNLARYTKIFENFVLGISIPYEFPRVVSEIFGRMVHFSEIPQFPEILETLRETSYICLRFEIFEGFLLNGNCPKPLGIFEAG